MTRLTLFLCLSLIAHAQNFEVASVKPAAPPMIYSGMNGGPGSDDPGRVTFSHATLKMLLTTAYGMQSYQIEGPEFLNVDRFDISAKLPPGATKEQMRVMLQNLLAERFGLKAHREKKEMPSYVLTTGKSGPKMKVSVNDSPGAAPTPGRPPVIGKDGFREIPSFGKGAMILFLPGKAKLMCSKCTMSLLAERLGQQLDIPVTDATGLTGEYDFTLIYEPVFTSKSGRTGPPPPPPNGIEGEPVSPLQTAVQELGLRMESKKSPVDIVVVDHIEKTPTEN